ncbi:MAG: hypothetical protein NTY12_05300 [Candidatus Falkowbacteria bacterium]|nr:hypothetical protein [Candidatus Falkowbacteria bacterium]
MKKVVFYSWQSDLPNATNRGFIQQSLENATKAIVSDNSVEIEPVVDRDTQGVSGSPDISATIFAKISAADVFVADVSLVARSENGRATPNPNVLLELGYALKSMGHERVILVFNKFFGNIENLPFDLRMRRLMIYNISQDDKDKAEERRGLERQFEAAIRSALDHTPIESNETKSVTIAIENIQANRIIILRRKLANFFKKICELQPKIHSEGGTAEELITAIDSTQESIVDFTKITETVSVMNDRDSAMEIYKWLGNILAKYYSESKSGRISDADGDYFRFIGHEMLVTMVALCIREKRWDIIHDVLLENIPVKYSKYPGEHHNIPWHECSRYVYLLGDEARKRSRLSLHSDILNTRHTSGGLSAVMPIDEFSAADFYLFLLSELPPVEYNDRGKWAWRPWSVLYMKGTPAFIKNADHRKYAQELANSFNISSIDEMKKRLRERYSNIHELFPGGLWDVGVREEDISNIGTL